MTKSAYIGLFSLLVLMGAISLVLPAVVSSFWNDGSPPLDSEQPDLNTTTILTDGKTGRAPVREPAAGTEGWTPGDTSSSRPVITPPYATRASSSVADVMESIDPRETASSMAAAHPVRHTVVSGDTYCKLSEKYYGAQKYWVRIRDANPGKNPRNLRSGDVVTIPPAPNDATAVASRSLPQTRDDERARNPLSGYKTHRVKSGEGFIKIAQEQLGDAGKWRGLYQLNRRLGLVEHEGDLKRNQVIALCKLSGE